MSKKQFMLLFGLLIATICVIPKEWERFLFFLFLLVPIVLSYKHFQFQRDVFKQSLLYLCIFIIANLSTLLLHIWQLTWELTNKDGLFGLKIDINHLLHSIPFNDGMWLRQFSHPLIEDIFVKIYIHGFVCCILSLAIYYVLTAQPKKIITALLAGHFLQYILILPFHFWLDGYQVWYIQNLWHGMDFQDPIAGYRTTAEPIIPSLNHVFPSMHTSIATVAIIMAWKEAAKPIKYGYSMLNAIVIVSTVYLGIHWVVDVIGGVIFGIFSFKLAEKIAAIRWKVLFRRAAFFSRRKEQASSEQYKENV